tara:strand:- start:2473 stop:3033 length:561 start_codon:yes stop_codon:yes gene_type:complete
MVHPGIEPVLSGAINGKTAFATMVKTIDLEPSEPTALYLDFLEVGVATASYLRESVFALKAYLRNVGSNFYPVAANANESVYDELLTIANARNDAIISCSLSVQGAVSDISLIGQLDPKQQMTFALVNELGKADAGSLMQQYGEEEQVTSTTAWNNRLAGLAARGLILEFTRGRSKYYRPVLEVSE